MKRFTFYHQALFILLMAIGFPAVLIARPYDGSKQTGKMIIEQSDMQVLADTIPGKKIEGQDKESNNKNGRTKRIGPERDRLKPNIKEVPRSIPKLKPKAITDRIPIRRIPVKIPKKGIRIHI